MDTCLKMDPSSTEAAPGLLRGRVGSTSECGVCGRSGNQEVEDLVCLTSEVLKDLTKEYQVPSG